MRELSGKIKSFFLFNFFWLFFGRFIFPCLLVITNDIMAYVFGYFLGKTKLIELSPKKTWEGFVGGCLSTLVFAIIVKNLKFV